VNRKLKFEKSSSDRNKNTTELNLRVHSVH
jgi:hypothetical protein